MSKRTVTYDDGPAVNAVREITTKDFAALIEAFEAKLGDGFELEPARFVEGGIDCKKYPGQNERNHKSVRIFINDPQDKWPIIEDDTLSKWKTQAPTKLISEDRRLRVFFKALEGAPGWTKKQIKDLYECMESIGLSKKKTKHKKTAKSKFEGANGDGAAKRLKRK